MPAASCSWPMRIPDREWNASQLSSTASTSSRRDTITVRPIRTLRMAVRSSG